MSRPRDRFNEAGLFRHLQSFTAYYQESRTQLSLDKDTPQPRPVQSAELDASLPFHRSAVCTTATSDAQPEFVWPHLMSSGDRYASNRTHPRMNPPHIHGSSLV